MIEKALTLYNLRKIAKFQLSSRNTRGHKMHCHISLFPLLAFLVAVNYSDGRYLLVQVEENTSIGESTFPGPGNTG